MTKNFMQLMENVIKINFSNCEKYDIPQNKLLFWFNSNIAQQLT